MSGALDGRVVFERAPAPHRHELRRMVDEGWSDDEILEAWRRLLRNLTLRGEREILAAAAYLRRQKGFREDPAPRGRRRKTRETFFAQYRDAVSRCRPGATDEELAAEMPKRERGNVVRGISLEWFQEQVQRFGRPPES